MYRGDEGLAVYRQLVGMTVRDQTLIVGELTFDQAGDDPDVVDGEYGIMFTELDGETCGVA